MKEVFLHILNRFNENANIKSQYTSLNEALESEFGTEKEKGSVNKSKSQTTAVESNNIQPLLFLACFYSPFAFMVHMFN